MPRDRLSCFAGRVGLSHNQPGDRLLDAADVVVTVGDPIEYDPVMWNKGKKRAVVHIDSTPAEMDADYWPAVELIGETAATVTAAQPHSSRPQATLKDCASWGPPAGPGGAEGSRGPPERFSRPPSLPSFPSYRSW